MPTRPVSVTFFFTVHSFYEYVQSNQWNMRDSKKPLEQEQTFFQRPSFFCAFVFGPLNEESIWLNNQQGIASLLLSCDKRIKKSQSFKQFMLRQSPPLWLTRLLFKRNSFGLVHFKNVRGVIKYKTYNPAGVLFSLLEESPTPSQQLIEDNFDGNICRCTGYRSILDAMKTFASDAGQTLRKKCVDIEVRE